MKKANADDDERRDDWLAGTTSTAGRASSLAVPASILSPDGAIERARTVVPLMDPKVSARRSSPLVRRDGRHGTNRSLQGIE
jgi:hypothetical protein